MEWLKPKMNFKQVIQKYGYPFISKEISNVVHSARHSKDGKWKTTRMKRLNGELTAPDGSKSRYNCERYAFLLDAPFDVHDRCCAVMKKSPSKNYEKKTGRKPFLAQMAEESQKKTQGWLKTGCNAFESKRPQSNPMAFWTEQDVLRYIKNTSLPICSVYGDVVPDYDRTEEMEGQMDISDLGLITDNRKFKTTGCNRTGCMFCGYGCHLNNDQRFVTMKQTHPKQYEYIMKPVEKGGLGYKEVIDWINEHGNMNIKY